MKADGKGELMKDLSKLNQKYRLRQAAGIYWILDIEQPGVPYREPLAVNAVGARIWELILEGQDRDQVAEVLCREYDIGKQQVLLDIEKFEEQLRTQGIEL